MIGLKVAQTVKSKSILDSPRYGIFPNTIMAISAKLVFETYTLS